MKPPKPYDPYSDAVRDERGAAALKEFEELAKAKAFHDRVKRGEGLDWNRLFKIEGVN